MAGQIRMSPETMRTRATQTDKQAQTVQEVISTMDKLLATLKGEWEGDAVKGYEDRYNKIKPAFKNAKELLDERTTSELQRKSWKTPTRASQASSESNFQTHGDSSRMLFAYMRRSAAVEMYIFPTPIFLNIQ